MTTNYDLTIELQDGGTIHTVVAYNSNLTLHQVHAYALKRVRRIHGANFLGLLTTKSQGVR